MNTNVDFVPAATIVAFAFLGLMLVLGIIGRCLASNHSTIRGIQNSDLMIYQAAPKQPAVARARRPSTDRMTESNGDSRNTLNVNHDDVKYNPVQRIQKKF